MLAGIFTIKIFWFCENFMVLCMHENYIIVLPVNNSWMWCAGFLGYLFILFIYLLPTSQYTWCAQEKGVIIQTI